MPTLLERIVQLGCSTRKHNEDCRRKICGRYGYCVPPRDFEHQSLYRCPFDADDAWLDRASAVGKIAERLKKIAEDGQSARGEPSPFTPKSVPDHLDLTKPLDFAALLTPRPDAQ